MERRERVKFCDLIFDLFDFIFLSHTWSIKVGLLFHHMFALFLEF